MRPPRKKTKKYTLGQKISRFLLLVIILVTAVGFYAWREVGQIVEAAQNQLPKGYSIAYESHYIDTLGRLTLTKPKLIHSSYGLLASGDKLLFIPSNWNKYFSLRENILLQTYIDKGEIRIPNITVHFADLSRTLRNHEHPMFSEVLAQGCSDKSGFEFRDLIANKISAVNGTFDLDFEYSAIASNIKINSAIRLDDFVDFEYQFEFNNASANAALDPYLVRGQWAVFNTEILNVRDEYCARLNDQDVEEFKEFHSSTLADFMAQQGVNLDQNMVARYAEFVRDPQSASMLFQPTTGVPITRFEKINYSNIVETLGMTLSLNAQSVQPLIASIDLEQVKRLNEPEKDVIKNEKEIIILKKPTLRQIRKLRQKDVKLITESNNEYKGRFLSVNSRAGRFEIRTKGGRATLTFQPRQIASIEYELVTKTKNSSNK